MIAVPLRFLAATLTVALAVSAAAEQTFVSEFDVAGLACDSCAATATEAPVLAEDDGTNIGPAAATGNQ